MNTDERRCPDALTERVIGAILEVSNVLGAGFLEKVYERALLRELGLRGIRASGQASYAIRAGILEDTTPISWSKTCSLSNSSVWSASLMNTWRSVSTTYEFRGVAFAFWSISRDPK